MREYPELSLKCIKGQPINDVSCRTLAEVGFPVDAPAQSEEIFSTYNHCWGKLYNTEYSVCGRVETEYIELLLQTKSREESFAIMLDRLSPYDITKVDLAHNLTVGCVFDLTAEESETLLDEFIYIIKTLLPRQLSDIYYSFDILPNPAYAIFYGLAGRHLGIEKCIDVLDGVKKRILCGETLYSIYHSTCATKKIIKKAYSEVAHVQRDHTWSEIDLGHIELALFGLSDRYSYTRDCSLAGSNETFDFIVYKEDIPVIAIDYWGVEYFNSEVDSRINDRIYDDMVEQEKQKDKICYDNNVSHLQIDMLELDEGMYVGNLIRNVLKNPVAAELHRMERSEYCRQADIYTD